jgi:hypothetical protein
LTPAEVDVDAVVREVDEVDLVERLRHDFDGNDGMADFFRLPVFGSDGDDAGVDVLEADGVDDNAAVGSDAKDAVVVVVDKVLK